MQNNLNFEDLKFINELHSRRYQNNTMHSNSTQIEQNRFKQIKSNLKHIADFFIEKYDFEYGEFSLARSTGNPIAYGGHTLNRVWTGLFKGSQNKQYGAQISFVINRESPSLQIGFYFGRASSHSLPQRERQTAEARLSLLGRALSKELKENTKLRSRFDDLLDIGFRTYQESKLVSGDNWVSIIEDNPSKCEITYHLHPNEDGEIELKTLDMYVSMLLPLMLAIPNINKDEAIISQVPPLTPEQRARQAERRTLIGEKGEVIAMEYELNRLESLGISEVNLPRHVALESMTLGYDILSRNHDNSELTSDN